MTIKCGKMSLIRGIDSKCMACYYVYHGWDTCEVYPDGIPELIKNVVVSKNRFPDNGCKEYAPHFIIKASDAAVKLIDTKTPSSFRKELVDEVFTCTDSVTHMPFFLEICAFLSDKEYWYALRKYYNCSDNLYHCSKQMKEAFQMPRKHRDLLMGVESRRFLETLPEQVTIYRAMTVKEFESGDFGVSWTLDKNVAMFFKDKYMRDTNTGGTPKMVHSLIIPKDKIIAYWNDMKEQVVIYIHQPILVSDGKQSEGRVA